MAGCRQMKVPAKRLLATLICFALLALSSIAASTTNNATPIEREAKAVMDNMRKEANQLRGAMSGKDEAAQQEAMKKYMALQKGVIDKLVALSKKDPKDPGTVDALTMIVFMGRNSKESKEALETLKHDYLNSSRIAPLCFWLGNDQENGPKLLKQIADNNPDPNVKGAALLCLAKAVKESEPAASQKYLQEVVTKYPDAHADLFGRKMDFAKEAKNELFEIEHLGVGKQAPEITGEDADGKKFSLSDYRGKVVMLDFWGDW